MKAVRVWRTPEAEPAINRPLVLACDQSHRWIPRADHSARSRGLMPASQDFGASSTRSLLLAGGRASRPRSSCRRSL